MPGKYITTADIVASKRSGNRFRGMNSPAFSVGQQVAISRLYGDDLWVDKALQSFHGRIGTITNAWCRTRDEMPELSKSFVYPDVWRYDVGLEDGTIVPGVPEAALSLWFNPNS